MAPRGCPPSDELFRVRTPRRPTAATLEVSANRRIHRSGASCRGSLHLRRAWGRPGLRIRCGRHALTRTTQLGGVHYRTLSFRNTDRVRTRCRLQSLAGDSPSAIHLPRSARGPEDKSSNRRHTQRTPTAPSSTKVRPARSFARQKHRLALARSTC